MLKENELFETILRVARGDNKIRGVILNGSRANWNAVCDPYQDYDIVYVVTETAPYLDGNFLNVFPEPILMQCPDLLDEALGKKTTPHIRRGWLMQFDPFNRLDLHVMTLEECFHAMSDEYYVEVLLDKDGTLQPLPQKEFSDALPSPALWGRAVNEFHWLFVNVFKGINRRELPYVTEMLERYIRPELRQMLTWYAAILHPKESVGKFAKRLEYVLPTELWERYLTTYAAPNYPDCWRAAESMLLLFGEISFVVASKLHLPQAEEENKNALALLYSFKNLEPEL